MHWRRNKEGKAIVYGDGTHNTTGLPRWFDISVMRTREYYKGIIIQSVGKALE